MASSDRKSVPRGELDVVWDYLVAIMSLSMTSRYEIELTTLRSFGPFYIEYHVYRLLHLHNTLRSIVRTNGSHVNGHTLP